MFWSRLRDLHPRGISPAVYKTAAVATEPHRRCNFGFSIGDWRLLRRAKVVEHQGNAPCIPVWKTGVCLSTPMLELESRAGFAPASAVLRTAACAARLTGHSKLVRKPGFAPGPSASQAEMLLLHHNPEMEIQIGALTWICTTNFRLRTAVCTSAYTLRAMK